MCYDAIIMNDMHHISLQCLVVYIAEAHAEDEWPISSARYNSGQEVHVPQSYSTESRIANAKSFFENFGYSKLVADSDGNPRKNSLWRTVISQPEEELGNNFSDAFEAIYKPWPFRAFGFVNNVVDFIVEPRDCEIDIQQITNWVSENTFPIM